MKLDSIITGSIVCRLTEKGWRMDKWVNDVESVQGNAKNKIKENGSHNMVTVCKPCACEFMLEKVNK